MINKPSETVRALLCFDANLPKLDKCKPSCEHRDGIPCIHRFNHKVQVERYNTKKFEKWSDLRILMYCLRDIFGGIAENKIVPDQCFFMILTRDRNFIEDVRKEWEESDLGQKIKLTFSDNLIFCMNFTIIIKQIACSNYGHSRTDSLKCIFQMVNNFLSEHN